MDCEKRPGRVKALDLVAKYSYKLTNVHFFVALSVKLPSPEDAYYED
jgi:hypothetical protein